MVSHEAWISPICILLRSQVKCITTLYTFYFSCVIKPQQIWGEIEAILDLTRQWQCLIKEYRGGLQGHKQTSTVGHSKLNKIGSLFLKIKDKLVKYRARRRHLFWFYDLNKINIFWRSKWHINYTEFAWMKMYMLQFGSISTSAI